MPDGTENSEEMFGGVTGVDRTAVRGGVMGNVTGVCEKRMDEAGGGLGTGAEWAAAGGSRTNGLKIDEDCSSGGRAIVTRWRVGRGPVIERLS